MVAAARLAAGLSGLRNRNTRVTNKTQLRVVKGSIETDPIILDDDDDEKNRILASQGVDEEDANEHHLQAALFASSQRTLSSAHFKPETTANDNGFIPTPDATGLVAEYDHLYPSNRYKDPVTHLRFSDSIDESCVGGLAGSFTYFLDERDAEWLVKNNAAAKGEGTSTSGSATTVNGIQPMTVGSPRSTPRVPHGRSSKVKGKEPELPPLTGTQPSVVIDEDNFELIVGLFEKWTDEIVSPYLHLDSNPEHFPDFSNYHNYFTRPLSPSLFSNFKLPANIPNPEKMVQFAKVVYPWWKERRMEREGKVIVPQLHVLVLEAQEKEDKMGGSPYTCFRKRDAKPMRRTRTNNVTHTEKLSRLRVELQNGLELAQLVVQREKLKRETVCTAAEIWRSREALVEYMKLLNGSAPGSIPPTDELLLFDKEQKPRRPKVEGVGSGRIILSTNRRTTHTRGAFPELDPHSPLMLNGDTSHAFEECQKWPTARTAGIQHEVERELLKVRKDDAYWEDIVDMPYQFMPSPSADKLYKPFPPPDGLTSLSSSSTSAAIQNERLASCSSRALRLRTGRGGCFHLDRRLHITKPHRLLQREWAGYPPRAEDMTAAQLHIERWAARSWRPRDAGVRLGRRERELGEDYWAHHSMFDDPSGWRVRNISGINPNREGQVPTFGFEQSISGWDAREPWARTRAFRGEEGWRPTPHLAIDVENLGVEVAARNAAERERIVEAWRGKTSQASGSDGGALALFTDGEVMAEPIELSEGNRDPNGDDMDARNDRAADAIDHAWKLDERWRYDSEYHDTDDRFLLDDYQSKFLRTTITLLDAQDQESMKTDPRYLIMPHPKHNRYLDHQLRLQHPGLPQLSSSATPTSATPHSMPLLQIPVSHSISTSRPVANGMGIQSQIFSLESATSSQNGNKNPATNGSVPPGSTSIPTSTWSKPNGTVSSAAARPPFPASNLHMNGNPVHTKQTNGPSLLHTGSPSTLPNGVNNHGNAPLNGRLPPHPAKGYPSLKATPAQTTPDRAIAAQPDPLVQQSGRLPYQLSMSPITGVNGSERATMNMSLGVGNLQLKKAQVQRTMSIRSKSVEENHTDTMHSETFPPTQTSDSSSVAHAQHFSLLHLPSTSTRTA